MRLSEVCVCSAAVAATQSRKAKIEAMAELLGRLAPEELAPGVSYLAGRMRQGRIGLGYAAVMACVVPAAASPAQTPETGEVEPGLSILEVDAALEAIAATHGSGSTARRQELLGGLMARATVGEQDFLRRLLFGELRQGALEGIVVEAVARAAKMPAADVRRGLMLSGSLVAATRAAFGHGEHRLEAFAVELFRPVQPMLAETCDDIAEAMAEMGSAAADFKLDGARIQVHKSGGDVAIYTRKLKDVTARLPEIVALVRELPARELVLDGEALALGPGGRPLPFQTTMTRFGRRLDVDRMRTELPLAAFFFDCLALDGALINRPGTERFRALRELLPPAMVIERAEVGSAAEAEAFYRRALAAGHEGIMLKSLTAPYEAGRRGASWLKVKPAHTLDLVVLAIEWGSGRRSGWLSNLHLGARDAAQPGSFVMLGKTFKGMTDDILRWQTETFQAIALGQSGHVVHVRPEIVAEIAIGDVQTSPTYSGGLALRFARLVRYRPDKTAAQADTFDAVRALHQRLHPEDR